MSLVVKRKKSLGAVPEPRNSASDFAPKFRKLSGPPIVPVELLLPTTAESRKKSARQLALPPPVSPQPVSSADSDSSADEDEFDELMYMVANNDVISCKSVGQ